MRELAERAYYRLCLLSGWLLRSARYSKVRLVREDGELQVRKHRSFLAPLLVRLGRPLVRILDTGVRVLRRREWQERERHVHGRLGRPAVRIDADGVLVLPFLPGVSLAALLEDPLLEESVRRHAIERAVVALARLHGQELTHGDAMAENVLIDLDAGAAHWLDFETVHDSSRPIAWRRADDVRALLTTCLLRTAREEFAGTLRLILNVYADEEVTHVLAESFGSVWQRPLTFHLGQAGLSFDAYREIGTLLTQRVGE